jgi:hypothetical protein
MNLFLPLTRYGTIKIFQTLTFAVLKSNTFAQGFLQTRIYRQVLETGLDFFEWGTFWIVTKYKNKYIDPPPTTTVAPTTTAATEAETDEEETTTTAYSSTSSTSYTRTTTPIYLDPEPEVLNNYNEHSSTTAAYNEGTTTTTTTTTEKYFYVYPETSAPEVKTSYEYQGPKRSTPKYLEVDDISESSKPDLTTSSTTKKYGVMTAAEEMLFNPQSAKKDPDDSHDHMMNNNSSASSNKRKHEEIEKMKKQKQSDGEISAVPQMEILEKETLSSTRKPLKYVNIAKLRRTTRQTTTTSTTTTTKATTTTASYIDVLDDPINVSSISDPETISNLISTIERLGQLLKPFQNNPEPSNVPAYTDSEPESSNEYHSRLTQPLSQFAKPLDRDLPKRIKKRSSCSPRKVKKQKKRFDDLFSFLTAFLHGL